MEPIDPLVLRLNMLCAIKDAEIAQLRQEILKEQIRRAVGASEAAIYDPNSMTFTEPPPAAAPVAEG